MALGDLKRTFILNAKNLIGWRTKRKIVVISVDDYGNVRLDSKSARDRLEKGGIKVKSPFRGFDLYDSLETREDLEALFEVLGSVKDKHGNHAVFTPFAVPCNINFEKVAESGFREFYNEKLTETYNKLSASQPASYNGTWNMWMEGIEKNFLAPQFHGREHVNLNAFHKMLEEGSDQFKKILENRCFARISKKTHPTISPTAAFDFWDKEENIEFDEILRKGLIAFEEVFGFRACEFNPPGGRESQLIHPYLKKYDIKYIDTPMIKNEHVGQGKYKKVFNYTGKVNNIGQMFIVRNVVFEPTRGKGKDGSNHAIKQIEAAFRWNSPAIISSHRVNFCGHIDESNRKTGLDTLKDLLHKIVRRWPDVEFMAADQLSDIINENKS